MNSYLTAKLKGLLVIYGLNQKYKEDASGVKDIDVDLEIKKIIKLDGSQNYGFQEAYEVLTLSEDVSKPVTAEGEETKEESAE